MDKEQFWHKAKKKELPEAVFSHVKALIDEQSHIHAKNLAHAHFYSNRDEPGLHGGTGSPRWKAQTRNVIKNVIDTAVSLVGITKTKVTFQSDGADWEIQQALTELEQLLFSMFLHLGFYDTLPHVFRDCCVFGKGGWKVSLDADNKIHLERVLSDNIIVDEREVPYGGLPRQLHQIDKVSSAVLKGMFPHANEHKLYEATTTIRDEEVDYGGGLGLASDVRAVVESWYLPTGNNPGRHTICTSNEVLLDEPYTAPDYPFEFIDWSLALTGWHGIGLAEGLLGFQLQMNEGHDFVRQVHRLIIKPKIFMDASSQLVQTKLDNTIGQIIPTIGRPPTFYTPEGLRAETYNYLDDIEDAAFRFAGVSSLKAHAQPGPNIEAGVAFRELSDNQNQRFAEVQQRVESMHLRLGTKILRLIRDVVLEEGPGALPDLENERSLKNIPWKKLDFDKHQFKIQVMPASILGETPAARKETIIEFAQYGVQLDQAEIRRYLGHPDLKAADDVATAKEEYAHWVVSQLTKGKWPFLEPAFIDPTRTLAVVNAAYLQMVMKEAPEAVRERTRQWMLALQAELKLLTEPTPEEVMQNQAAAAAGEGPTIPAGNTAETGLPGILEPEADTAQTLLPGLVPQ